MGAVDVAIALVVSQLNGKWGRSLFNLYHHRVATKVANYIQKLT
ncbi:hypothetical protein [Phormidium nigroviride]